MSKLVNVHSLGVVTRGEFAVLALRWEATGPGSQLFPVLDADMSLTPAGEDFTRLSLAGVYRPPFAALDAGLDRAVFHKVADATARSLLARVADVLAPPGACQHRAGPCRVLTLPGPPRAGQMPKFPSPAALRSADQADGDRTRRS
jgi:hypothetical protein